MIIEALLNGIYGLMSALMVFKIPDLPADIYAYIETAFDYVSAGAGLLANYVPLGYLMTLFGVLLAVDGALLLYKFVMWIIRKIPVLNVS